MASSCPLPCTATMVNTQVVHLDVSDRLSTMEESNILLLSHRLCRVTGLGKEGEVESEEKSKLHYS